MVGPVGPVGEGSAEVVDRSEDPLFVEDEVPIRDLTARTRGVESVTGHTVSLVGDRPPAAGFTSYLLRYRPDGRRARQERFEPDGRLSWRCHYDDDGKPLQEITYDASGEIDYQLDIVYSGDLWTEKRMYPAPGRLHYRIVADRDANGRLTRQRFVDASGLVIRSDSQVYDGLGRLVRVVSGALGESSYDYDDRRNLTRRSRNRPGAGVTGDVAEFEYAGSGLLSTMRRPHVSLTSFSYTVGHGARG